jgi:hypothetical protein
MRTNSIRALGLALLLAACSDTDVPTGVPPSDLVTRPATLARAMTNQYFFDAWSWPDTFRVTPIHTVSARHGAGAPRLDARFDRQAWYDPYSWFYSDRDAFVSFAQAHPGNLYLIGDEENQQYEGIPNGAQNLATDYCSFIKAIYDADNSAKFSLSFDLNASHSFMESVKAAKGNTPCASMPDASWMAEWTIDIMADWNAGFTGFRNWVNSEAAWAVANGAKLTLGSWILGAAPSSAIYANRLLSAMELLAGHPNVAHSRYLAFEPWPQEAPDPHPLANAYGVLTPEGVVYANYQRTLSPNPFYLASDLGQGYMQWQSNVHGSVQFRRVYWQENVYIGGVQYFNAIGMHAPYSGVGQAEFAIPVGATSFISVFGFARQDNSNGGGDANGRVYVDGNLVWSQHIVGSTYNSTAYNVSISIPPHAKRLRLEVDNGSDGTHSGDQTTWGDPKFTGPGVTISGPPTVSQVGSQTWYANASGPDSYTMYWQASTDDENSWSDVGVGSSYTQYFSIEGPYTMILRAKMVNGAGRIRTSKFYVNVETHCPGGQINCQP